MNAQPGLERKIDMAQDFLPEGETQFKAWLDNFVTQCAKYDDVLGLDAESYGEIALKTNAYDAALGTTVSLKEELKGATAFKGDKRADISSLVRSYARQWKSNPAIPSNVLGALGIVSSSTSGPVVTVTGLQINACANGVNEIKWNRTGNAPSTIFLVENRMNLSTDWDFVAAVTRTNYNHEGQTPGQAQFYRITSIRAGVNSAPCAEVGVYTSGGSGETTLEIAA